jgi:hypothetical protein
MKLRSAQKQQTYGSNKSALIKCSGKNLLPIFLSYNMGHKENEDIIGWLHRQQGDLISLLLFF